MKEGRIFLWGASTALYQVEGGITNNDWDFFTSSERIKKRISRLTRPNIFYKKNIEIFLQPAGDATKFWDPRYYEKDFDLARGLGLNTFRIGIEWARIEPERGHWNQGDGDGQNETLDDGNKSLDSGQPSINCEPQGETEAIAARIDPITEHANHENGVNNNNSIDRNDILKTENSEKEARLSPISVASVASVAEIRDQSEKDVPPSSKSVASVASVASTDSASSGLPEIPCAWCDYKNTIEFDLGNHLLANHRGELMKLPVGKGSMDDRIDCAIQQTKRMMAAQYDDEDEDAESNDDE